MATTGSALKVKKKLPGLVQWGTKANRAGREAFDTAIVEALAFVQEKAMEILKEEVYDKERAPFAPQLTEELLNSWVHTIRTIGYGVAGTLVNTSDHAGYLEWGTDDEGLGSHVITARRAAILGRHKRRSGAPLLHWYDPQTGFDRYAQQVTVSGVEPLHFLERAVVLHEDEIVDIFVKHLRIAIDKTY